MMSAILIVYYMQLQILEQKDTKCLLRWWVSLSAEVNENITWVTVRTRVTPSFRVRV